MVAVQGGTELIAQDYICAVVPGCSIYEECFAERDAERGVHTVVANLGLEVCYRFTKEDAAADFTEQFAAEMDELDNLLNDPAVTPEEIHAKRLEIAALVEFGEEMDSGFGVPLEIIPVVAAAFNGISNLLFRHLQEARSWLSTTEEALSNDETIEDVEDEFEVNIAIVENVYEQLQQYASTELR